MAGRVVLLGNFDGVHIGHQALIKAGKAEAKKRGLPLSVWTFDTLSSPALTTCEERAELLSSYGVEEIFTDSFDRLKGLSPEEFVRDVLVSALGAEVCVCGYNYSFGRGGVGTPALLTELCLGHGVEVKVVKRVTLDGGEVSSTEVRASLSNGEIRRANALLGRPYSIVGRVERGAQRGREVGMPTANLYPHGLCLPKNGVYATVAHLPTGESLLSVTNIGVRPTMNDGRGMSVETYILDFDRDIYGERIRVEFCGFIRDERRFSSLSEVSAQVRADIEGAREILEKTTFFGTLPL